MGASLTGDEVKFRKEIRSWLGAEMRRPYLAGFAERSSSEVFGIEPGFTRSLGRAGYIGITAPAECGGVGRTHVDDAILQSELAWHRSPQLGHFVAEREVLPALIKFGTDEQKRQFVSGILAGDILCGQCFTEPGAGSDLAAISTSARPSGDGFVINGIKWLASVAHVASHLWVIARTDPLSRHAGLSMFLIPADLPGIRIEPLAEMTGVRRLNTIYFEGVHVDQGCLVGGLNQGWSVAIDSVARERSGSARPASVRRLLSELRDHLDQSGRQVEPTSAAMARLIDLRIRADACELLCIEHARAVDAGHGDWAITGNTIKIAGDVVEQDAADAATEWLGVDGLADIAADAPLGGRAARLHLAAPAFTLGGGTTEILKTVMATRGLGLPRSGATPARAVFTSGQPDPLVGDGDAQSLVAWADKAGLVDSLATGLGLDVVEEFAANAAAHGSVGVLVPHVVVPSLLWPSAWSADHLSTVALGDNGEDFELTASACALEEVDASTSRLTGSKRYVSRALDCSRALVAAQSHGELVLVNVDTSAAGVDMKPSTVITKERDADMLFDGVRVPTGCVLRHEQFRAGLERAVWMSAFVQAAEGVGVIRELVRRSVAYGQERHAFGQPIGAFQAYQHHCAHLAMMLEAAGALTRRAALGRSRADAIRARIFAANAAVQASRIAVQLHGGQGFLDDNLVSHLYRMAKVSQVRWGGPAWHARRTADLLLEDRSVLEGP